MNKPTTSTANPTLNAIATQSGGRRIYCRLNPLSAIEIGTTWQTGVTLRRVWVGHKRLVVEFYSAWNDGRGRCIGTHYRVLVENQEILDFCLRAGIRIPAWIKAEEIS